MKNENKTQKAFKETGEKLAKADPEFTEIVTNFIQGEVVQASRLTEKERLLCILSVLLGCQGMGEFRNLLHTALDAEIEPVAIKEVLYQAVAYLGLGRIHDFLIATNEIMEQHGIQLPLSPQATTNEKTRFGDGLAKQVYLHEIRVDSRSL